MTIDDLQTKKVTDLSVLESVGSDALMMVHDGNGLKTVTKEAFLKENTEQMEAVSALLAAITMDGAGAHNAIFRGKNLGNKVTAEQYAAISSGKFTDLYIGDYWVISNVTYRIAAFDYYLRGGDTDFTTHHAVIVPDTALYNAQMNTSSTTAGGYVGSAMYTANLAQAKTTVKAAFSGHVLKHREWLVNAVSNGRASGGTWSDSEIDLMTEQMVYGSGVFSPVSDGSTVPTNYRVAKSQLPLFAYRPDMISNRTTYWLRDVVSAAAFAYVSYHGDATCYGAASSLGVRPAFCIG